VSPTEAYRIAVEWPQAMLDGRPVDVPAPVPAQKKWFGRLFGG
jgi:hypothetical protein